MSDCATDHVIRNADFGLEPVKDTGPVKKTGSCHRCQRRASLKKCQRCAKYFCTKETT